MDPVGEIVPEFGSGRKLRILAEALVEAGAKLVGCHIAAGDTDYPYVRYEATLGVEVGQSRGELVAAQVARGAENYDGGGLV